jgi:hypothetical protein
VSDIAHHYNAMSHPVFAMPEAGTAIWRYMSLAKLLSLVESGSLFFCYADRLGDPFEGALPKETQRASRQYAEAYMAPGTWERMAKGHNHLRKVTAISCWHMGEHESAAMWQLYAPTGEGVAVRSTVGRLAGSLPQTPTPHRTGITDISIGRVKYLDYDRERIPEGNFYWPFVHKRRSYEHERELRALTITPAGEPEHCAPSSGPGGIAIPINVEQLIDRVFVAPSAPAWFEELIRAILGKLGLRVQVEKSRLGEDPLF